MPRPDPTPPRAGDPDAQASASPDMPRMTEAKLRDWVRQAQPGARVVYASGAFVDQFVDKALPRLAHKLCVEDGLLRLHLKRRARGGPIDYLAYRTKKPVLPGMTL